MGRFDIILLISHFIFSMEPSDTSFNSVDDSYLAFSGCTFDLAGFDRVIDENDDVYEVTVIVKFSKMAYKDSMYSTIVQFSINFTTGKFCMKTGGAAPKNKPELDGFASAYYIILSITQMLSNKFHFPHLRSAPNLITDSSYSEDNESKKLFVSVPLGFANIIMQSSFTDEDWIIEPIPGSSVINFNDWEKGYLIYSSLWAFKNDIKSQMHELDNEQNQED